jgi:hypothetical protein
LNSFSDKYNLYSIGSADVNISREDAVALSYLYVENLTWTADGVEVTDFNIVEEGTDPELLTRCRDNPLELYPYWYVLLYLDDVYPGDVRHIQVMLWADTGNLIDCQPLTFGGGTSPTATNTETPATEQSAEFSKQEETPSFPYVPIAAVVATTIIAVAIMAIVRKKKQK